MVLERLQQGAIPAEEWLELDRLYRIEMLKFMEQISIREAPRLSEISGSEEVIIRVITVAAADEVQQGPDVEIPPGWEVTVRQRHHVGTNTGRVAFSRSALNNDNERSLFRDNDSASFKISNLDQVWFSAETIPTGGLKFELFVER